MGNYDRLLSPIEVSPGYRLKNRIVKAGQSTFRWNDDATAQGSDAIGLYESIAAGGAAAITIGGVMWDRVPGGHHARGWKKGSWWPTRPKAPAASAAIP